jgi:hypothetical protein
LTDCYLVAHWYNADTFTASPSQINFLIFVPLFSFVSIAYLEITPRFVAKGLSILSFPRSILIGPASQPYAHLGFEVLNMFFYFVGFIALAAFLGNLLFCRGSVCVAARVDAVFAAFSWVLWTGSTAILALEIFKGGLSGMRTDMRAKSAMKEVPSTVGP